MLLAYVSSWCANSYCIIVILSFYRTVLFCITVYHAYVFIVQIMPAYKWLPFFAADVKIK